MYMVDYWAGKIPLLLTAGHDGDGVPPGVTPRNAQELPNFTTIRDMHTQEIVVSTATSLENMIEAKPYGVVAKFSRKYVDVNRPRWEGIECRAASPYYTAYHAHIRTYCRSMIHRWGRGLLMDIHGTAISLADVYLGTCGHMSVENREVVYSFGHQLQQCGYRVIINHPRLGGGWTTWLYGVGEMDAIQVELSPDVRKIYRENIIRHLSTTLGVMVHNYLSIPGLGS